MKTLGAPPAPNQEFYGETFAGHPLESLPVEFREPGTIPPSPDDSELHASVRNQITNENGELRFRGWMRSDQKTKLLAYSDELDWQCTVEKLYAALCQAPGGEQLLTLFHRSVTSLVRKSSDLKDAFQAFSIVAAARTSAAENRRVELTV